MLSQCNGYYKLSIGAISDTNAFRALVKDNLPSTGGSGLFLWNKFVRTKRRHFITVLSLDDNELFMTKFRYFNYRIIFKVEMKVNNNKSITMKLHRQER